MRPRLLALALLLAVLAPAPGRAAGFRATADHSCPDGIVRAFDTVPTAECEASATAEASPGSDAGTFAIDATLRSLQDGRAPGIGFLAASVAFETEITLPASDEPIDVVTTIGIDSVALERASALFAPFDGRVEAAGLVDPQFACHCFVAAAFTGIADTSGRTHVTDAEYELRIRVASTEGLPITGGPATLRIGIDATLENRSVPAGGRLHATATGFVSGYSIEPPTGPPPLPREAFDTTCRQPSPPDPGAAGPASLPTASCTAWGSTNADGTFAAGASLSSPLATVPGIGATEAMTTFRRTVTVPPGRSYVTVEAILRIDHATMTRTGPVPDLSPTGMLVLGIRPQIPCNTCSLGSTSTWTLLQNEGEVEPGRLTRRAILYTTDSSDLPAGDFEVVTFLGAAMNASPATGTIATSYAGLLESVTLR